MNSPLTFPPLNVADAVALGTIIDMAVRTASVAWLAESGDVMEGTARHICDERGYFTPGDVDIRGEFLRITTSMGFEHFLPMMSAIDMVKRGELVIR